MPSSATGDLNFPQTVSVRHRGLLSDLAARNHRDHGDGFLGLVLSGSAGRGLATERSDLDVYVVLSDAALKQRTNTRSPEVDEVPVTVPDLEQVPAFGTAGWWFRWSFAWAPVLLDRTAGRIPTALHRQATVTHDEAERILVGHDRLDGWLNFAYRSLKNDRDGRELESRLDAAESLPWLLDVIFSLAGRVRPYHKYLPWELREHPLPGWSDGELLDLVRATLEGDAAGIRQTFERVRSLCVAFDEARNRAVLVPVIEGWGEELRLFRREPHPVRLNRSADLL